MCRPSRSTTSWLGSSHASRPRLRCVHRCWFSSVVSTVLLFQQPISGPTACSSVSIPRDLAHHPLRGLEHDRKGVLLFAARLRTSTMVSATRRRFVGELLRGAEWSRSPDTVVDPARCSPPTRSPPPGGWSGKDSAAPSRPGPPAMRKRIGRVRPLAPGGWGCACCRASDVALALTWMRRGELLARDPPGSPEVPNVLLRQGPPA